MDVFKAVTKIEERLVLNATQKNIPLGGAFELLPLCNMDCRMCYLRLSPSEMHAQGRLRNVDEWLSLAKEARDAGLLFLLLTGGEVFLYPEFDRLYRELYKMGFFITINSNGSLITNEIADLLKECLPRRINITLYGASDETYGKLCGNPKGFTQTMNGIKLLLDRKIPVKLNGSINADNKDDLDEILHIADELGLPIEVDTYMFPAERKGTCAYDYKARLTVGEAADLSLKVRKHELGQEEYQNWIGQMTYVYDNTHPVESSCGLDDKKAPDTKKPDQSGYEELPCRAVRSSFWINWKGNMTPCVFMEEPAASVFEIGFDAAWKQINKKRQQIYLPAACTCCERRSCCTVCAASVMAESKDMNKKPDYLCAIINEKLRLAHEQSLDIDSNVK